MWRAWAICCLSIGCLGHTTLPAPPPTLTAEQRVVWFQQLSGATERTTWTTVCQTGCETTVNKTMTLSNGTTIEAAEDLLPVVAPDSTTARHARASLREREHGERWDEITLGVIAAAIIAAAASDHSSPFDDRASAAIWGSAFVIGLFGHFVARDSYNESTKEAGIAFQSYTKDLADRLEICVLNMQLVPCEYRAPAPAPPAPPSAPAPPPVPAGQSVPDGPVAGR